MTRDGEYYMRSLVMLALGVLAVVAWIRGDDSQVDMTNS